MLAQIAPWATAAAGLLTAALAVARLIWVERFKAKSDERSGSNRLFLDYAERVNAENAQLQPLRHDALHREECCRLMLGLILASTSEEWVAAEKAAVAFLRRMNHAAELEGVDLGSEMEAWRDRPA